MCYGPGVAQRAVEYENPATLDSPVGQYSNLAVTAAGAKVAHVAGQLPVDAEAKPIAEDFDAQAEAVFAQLAKALEAAGSSMANLTSVNTFLVAEDDLPRFRDARRRAFERYGVDPPPPATTVIVRALLGGSRIEISATAVVPT
jgi:enamine deaminase RidA (YjgF/YER057c/UK114 family)